MSQYQVTIASIDTAHALWGSYPPVNRYEDCESGLEAIKVYLRLLEEERAYGLRLDPTGEPNYFLEEIFAAKIALMFLMSFDEAQAISKMEELNHEYLRSGSIYLDSLVETLKDRDYSSLEF